MLQILLKKRIQREDQGNYMAEKEYKVQIKSKEPDSFEFDRKVKDYVAQEFADEYKDEIEAQGGKMF